MGRGTEPRLNPVMITILVFRLPKTLPGRFEFLGIIPPSDRAVLGFRLS